MNTGNTKNVVLGAWVEGIGLLAPGLADWPTARAVLAGELPYLAAPTVLPVPAILPPAERRRASRLVKLALAAGMEAVTQAGADASTLTTVFSASCGDGHNCHALCETLASDDRMVSPTRFTNSVHNNAAGYWGIATGARAPCQVLSAYDASFGAGLLEAMVQVSVTQALVLLIAYDAEYPEPIHAKRPTPDAGGVALLLAPERSASSLASLRLCLDDGPGDTLDNPQLETLRTAIPAMHALPLLERIARNEAGVAGIDYLSPLRLAVEVGT